VLFTNKKVCVLDLVLDFSVTIEMKSGTSKRPCQISAIVSLFWLVDLSLCEKDMLAYHRIVLQARKNREDDVYCGSGIKTKQKFNTRTTFRSAIFV
jgi:hypothetical protein